MATDSGLDPTDLISASCDAGAKVPAYLMAGAFDNRFAIRFTDSPWPGDRRLSNCGGGKGSLAISSAALSSY